MLLVRVMGANEDGSLAVYCVVIKFASGLLRLAGHKFLQMRYLKG